MSDQVTNQVSNQVSNQVNLNIMYDIESKEIMIGFKNPQQAEAYRARNHEARILRNTDASVVWLPIADLKYVRSNKNFGMELVFKDGSKANKWKEGTPMAQMIETDRPEKESVYIRKEWERAEFNDALGIGGE
ncbi:hypothetical protein F4820DRAFT_432178 [Hypoxylon rubiginosum]|uniref:Uncharacterized protein n=1 Tax=Hypoxylon rubiginosum TaxID=110542 RepID=A0ACB9YSE4_9PEZI|nr:hypothetical protein F4820DRAFT_432178 [Hypoxylon rubiginosum]